MLRDPDKFIYNQMKSYLIQYKKDDKVFSIDIIAPNISSALIELIQEYKIREDQITHILRLE